MANSPSGAILGANKIDHGLSRVPGSGGALTSESIVGVVTNGLFAARGADVLLLGTAEEVRTLVR